MRSSLVHIAADSTVPKLEENHLPMPHWLYGATAFAVFLALLGVLWMFRNTADQDDTSQGKKDH